jgi:hypothetical protein
MDKKNYGFVTFADPKIAMKFLEVCAGRQQQHLGDSSSSVGSGSYSSDISTYPGMFCK